MSAGLLAARLLLAAVFVVAAIAKAADQVGTREAMTGFGVPKRLTGAGAVLLPLAELAVAGALLPGSGAEAGLVASAALLTLFTAAMARTLANGRTPACNCFGSIGSRPIGSGTLVRNGVLLAFAISAAALGADRSQQSATGWIATLPLGTLVAIGAGTVGALTLALTWWFLLQLLRQNGRLLARVQELEEAVGIAPPLTVPGVDGKRVAAGQSLVGHAAPALADTVDLELGAASLGDLLDRGRSVALVFTDPGCGPCNLMLPELADLQQSHRDALTVAVLTRGPIETARAKREEHGLKDVLLDGSGEAFRAYGAVATPSAVLIDKEGVVRAADVRGRAAVVDLIARAAARQAAPRTAVAELTPARVVEASR